MTQEEITTKRILDFREAVRSTWNQFFSHVPFHEQLSAMEAFPAVEDALFRSLVSGPLGFADESFEYAKAPFTSLCLRPRSGITELKAQRAKIDPRDNVVWSLPDVLDSKTLSSLRFFSLFDWNWYGHVDLCFFRAVEVFNGERSSKEIFLLKLHDVDFVLIK